MVFSTHATGEPVARTIALCFLAALFEGLDIQSMGVAAPHLAKTLALGSARMGVVLSASIVGLMIGAAWGGVASDRYGRKPVLVVSMLALSGFSLLTLVASGYWSMVTVRLLAGLGLGGSLPNLIALAADVAPEPRRARALGIVYGGMPLGGAMAGFTGLSSWQAIFLIGGIGPLLLIPALAFGLPRHRPLSDQGHEAIEGGILFGARRKTTMLLWSAYFFTLLAVYFLLNWLPTLVAGRTSGPIAAISLNLGAVAGSCVIGRGAEGQPPRIVLAIVYAAMIASLVILCSVDDSGLLAACFGVGFFVIGGQLVLYALATLVYPTEHRGTGVGAAVAVGRAGSIAGPLLGGVVLAWGADAAIVPLLPTPGLLVAFAAARGIAKKKMLS